MAAPRAGDIPMGLKAVKPFLIIHKQLEKEQPVVAYYVLMYAVQEGIKVGSSPESKAYLLSSMDKLATMKKELLHTYPDEMHEDIVAQVHIGNFALNLFERADQDDRLAKFSKNLSKRFFTASQIFMTLKQFGELPEEIEGKMKYAKWKAVEIDKCLKNGITPTPGPPGGFKEQHDEPAPLSEPSGSYDNQPGPSSGVPIGFDLPPVLSTTPPQPQMQQPPQIWPQQPPQLDFQQPPPIRQQQPPQIRPQQPPEVKPVPKPRGQQEVLNLGPAETSKAQKYCKFASSALEYEDVEGAIEYLSKALNLLKTGKDI